MRIIDTRHETPDDYTIKDVAVNTEVVHDPGRRRLVYTNVRVSLEPEPYLRNRFALGQSHEKKKHGARELIISHEELQQMIGALRGELDRCYQFLCDHKLLSEYCAL